MTVETMSEEEIRRDMVDIDTSSIHVHTSCCGCEATTVSSFVDPFPHLHQQQKKKTRKAEERI